MPPLLGSYRIPSLMFLSDNGRLEFTRPFLPLPSFLLPSFWCRYLLFHSLPPIDSHLDHRFNFDPHTCGLLHLGLANFLLGPFPFTFPNGSRSLAVLLYVGTVPPPPPTSHNMVYISAC